jgi:hypothetical protein
MVDEEVYRSGCRRWKVGRKGKEERSKKLVLVHVLLSSRSSPAKAGRRA